MEEEWRGGRRRNIKTWRSGQHKILLVFNEAAYYSNSFYIGEAL